MMAKLNFQQPLLTNIFIAMFDQFNNSLLNKSIYIILLTLVSQQIH